MKIKLNGSMGRSENGRLRTYTKGDVIEVSKDEGQRMIASNRGIAVDAPKAKKQKPKTLKQVSTVEETKDEG